jgi:hypothetical protein
MLVVVLLPMFADIISKDFWSQSLLNFSGEHATAYVGDKHDASGIRGPKDRIIEVWLIAKDGSHQYYEFRVTHDIYESVEAGSPIEVVYDPSRPERAYPVHGQESPKWLYYVMLIVIPPLVIGTIVRFRNLLFMRVW